MPSKPYKPVLLERLKNQEYSINYLTEVFQNETQEAFLVALRNVIGCVLASPLKRLVERSCYAETINI